MEKTAVVTGAGSGVGRATAIALAKEGWKVALVGRNEATLRETADDSGCDAGRFLVYPCDVSDPALAEQMGAAVFEKFGSVEVLVNSAGANIPNRSFETLSLEDYHTVINTNLNAAYYCIRAFLPSMRERKSGTIVNVISDAGIFPHVKSGPSYVASKFGLRGLTQSLNAEEKQNGIRACSLCPGDIDTKFIEKRPVPPTREQRSVMLQPEDVAACALLAINLPERVLVEEIIVRPRTV